ncbi:MAG: hypothetical protein Q8P58_01620 [Candidatus Adlerbacteria bacterium]|nr:hypothetical protein [Candidatus Adlerbacteria bacterium]
MPHPNFKTTQTHGHLFWRFFLGLIAVGTLLFVGAASVKATWGMYQTFDIAAAERAVAEAELASLRAEHVQMTATLASFTSQRGLEAAVRERFGVARPGEGEIRIVRSEEDNMLEESVNNNPFSRLFDALFKW